MAVRQLEQANVEDPATNDQEESKEDIIGGTNQDNNENEYDSDNSVENHNNQQNENMYHLNQFPISARDKTIFTSEDGQTTQDMPILVDIETASEFPHCPSFSIKGDIDSIYMLETNLRVMMESLPKKNILSMGTVINARNKITTSRYYIDASQLPNPPLIRNNKLEKISLEFFPSIH